MTLFPWSGECDSEPGRPIRVIVVDDDPAIRDRVVREIAADPRMQLVADGGSVRAGKRLIATRTFDVMLVDLNLGDGSGFELIEYMKCTRDYAEAIVISVLDDEQKALRAFELGAAGYLTKNTAFGQFPTAVLQVWHGGACITPTLARRLLQRLRPVADAAPAPAAQTTQDADVPLSAREIEVLKLIAIGYTNPEIAQRLNLSVQTVHTHVRNAYTKLHVNSRAQAVSKATRRRLI